MGWVAKVTRCANCKRNIFRSDDHVTGKVNGVITYSCDNFNNDIGE